jgi:hypothetical protein
LTVNEKCGISVTIFNLSWLLVENNKSTTGINMVKFINPNMMDNKVNITYGIANFSIGFAKARILKYTFIGILQNNRTTNLMKN